MNTELCCMLGIAIHSMAICCQSIPNYFNYTKLTVMLLDVAICYLSSYYLNYYHIENTLV